MNESISTSKAPKAFGAYSEAIKTGNYVFTSGQISLDPNTGVLVEGGIEAQTKQVMENLKQVILAGGLNFEDVVKTTIFLKDMNSFVQVNEAYGAYFTKDFPARATVEASRLPKDANVEICMEAIKF